LNRSLLARISAVAVALAVACCCGGCVVETAVATSPSGVAVTSPPPPPVIETRPAAPTARAVWIAGYWHWTGMQYTWIPGHWEEARPGAVWRAPRYWLREGVYIYEPGAWALPAPPPPPRPLPPR
jgi:hypothetical protein